MGLDRRAFLKFTAGAGVGILATPVVWKTLDDLSIWTQNWPWTAKNPNGLDTYVTTTSKLCPSACGMKIRLVNGQPVRALSHPDHPLGGGISPLAAAEVQLLYSPARLKQPLLRKGDGTHVQISWEEAEKMLLEKATAAKQNIACISGDENGSSLDVLSAFIKRSGSSNMYLMPSDAQSAMRAWDLMGGKGQIGYDIDGADYILSIGANYLESWGTFIRNRKVFAEGRPHGEEPSTGFAYAGPVQNNTASVADTWLAIKPGTEAILAMGIAQMLIAAGKSAPAAGFGEFQSLAATYTPENVQKLTGVCLASLQEVVDKLMAAEKPLVIVGSEFGQGGGAAPVMAGIAVNLLLGSSALTEVKLASPAVSGAQSRMEVYRKDAVAFLANPGDAKMLILYNANPVYALPEPAKTKENLAKIPFKVAFTAFLDESAMECDLVLPVTLGLEGFDDIDSPYGCASSTYAMTRAVTKCWVNAKNGMDMFMAMATKLGVRMPANFGEVLTAKAKSYGMSPEELLDGKVFTTPARPASGLNLNPAVLAAALKSEATSGLALAPMQKNAMGTAQTGIPPFNVKTIRKNELVGTEMCVLLNKATAAGAGLNKGDRVKLSSGSADITARVTIFEGVAPDTVGVYLGFGHTALDEFSKNKGANVAGLFAATAEPQTDLTVWNQTGVSIMKA